MTDQDLIEKGFTKDADGNWSKPKRNKTNSQSQSPIVERALRNEPLATAQTEKGNPGKFLVRVTSFRRRLLDEDNLSEKFFCDCCRYAGLIPDDSPEQAQITVSQQKVKSKDEERTEITIERIA